MNRSTRLMVALLAGAMMLPAVGITAAAAADGALQGMVFEDIDGDGQFDAGESGLGGYIYVWDGDGDLIFYDYNEDDGSWSVPGLAPGEYTVEVELWSGEVASSPNPRSVTVTDGAATTADFGFYDEAAIEGQVFEDQDQNGIPSSQEWGADATVTLRRDGTVVSTRTLKRENDGSYWVDALRPGSYSVTVTYDSIYTPTTPTTRTVELLSGGRSSANFGLYRKPVSVTGVVFHDRNGNGIKDPGEGISDVSVSALLYNSDGQHVATDELFAADRWSFSELEPGSYAVDLRMHTMHDAQDYFTSKNPIRFTLKAGDELEFATGIAEPGAIWGSLREDTDRDGIPDDGWFRPGMTVELLQGGKVIDSYAIPGLTSEMSRYSFEPLAPGDYMVRVLPPPLHHATTAAEHAVTVSSGQGINRDFTIHREARGVRIAGDDRLSTAAAISRAAFPRGAGVAYVATGAGFADALAAGPAASMTDGPVLLTVGSELHPSTRDELRRLKPDRIVVMGGQAAVPNSILAELSGLSATVQRIAGSHRFETAAMVSAATFDPGVSKVTVATGENFPDALAGGASAAAAGGPLLLVGRDVLPEAVADELVRLKPARIDVLGGTAAISDAVANILDGYATRGAARVAGENRFDTAARVAARMPGTPARVAIATGLSYPDALAGVPLAGRHGSPLLLVSPTELPPDTRTALDSLKPYQAQILGGSAAVSNAVRDEILQEVRP